MGTANQEVASGSLEYLTFLLRSLQDTAASAKAQASIVQHKSHRYRGGRIRTTCGRSAAQSQLPNNVSYAIGGILLLDCEESLESGRVNHVS
jgi:hypothetical protein